MFILDMRILRGNNWPFNYYFFYTIILISFCFLCSNPGHPFAVGATLRKLSALTVDDFGKETFATGGALQNIQKVK